MSLITTKVRMIFLVLQMLTGPGTVFCDNMNLLFMFLSIATSNMVATSLAKGVSSYGLPISDAMFIFSYAAKDRIGGL